jgi:hypothetical protein
MDRGAATRDRFNWLLPFFAAIGALILFVPIIYFGGNSGILLVLFAPVISFTLLVVALIHAFRKRVLRGLAVLSMLVVYWAVSWFLLMNFHELHSTIQWSLQKKEWKMKLQAQPDFSNGELEHTIWDGSGIPCCDTWVYLVFDPKDSLLAAAKSRSPGRFSGIPCEVHRVHRLESHYYSILFYTDTSTVTA